jgi:hypothetical protein
MVPASRHRNDRRDKGDCLMRMTIALALLALAACNKEPELKLKNATVEEVAAKAKAAGAGEMRPEPGQWKVVTTMKLLEVEGVPEAAAAQMKGALARTATNLKCLTPEDVQKPNLFAGRDNSRCKYDDFDMKGGKIKATMHCPGQSGGEMGMTLDGAYTPQSYNVLATMDMQMPTAGQSMKMTMQANGTRIGECPAEPAKGG